MTTATPYRVLYDGRNRKTFLHTRNVGVGASEISAVLGFSKFQTPYDVWERKTGRAPFKEQTQAMEWGIALESVIARRFSVRHGHEDSTDYRPIGKVLPALGVLQSIAYPHLLATPDRIILEFATKLLRPLEIKTANAFSRADWAEGAPLYYEAQNQSQQLVMFGDDAIESPDDFRGWIVPLLGGNDMPDPFEIPFAADFAIHDLIEYVGEWWHRHVVNDTPPPLTLRDDVNRLYPARRGQKLVATERLLELVADRNALQPKMSADKKLDDAIKAEIKLAMLDNTVLVDKEGDEGRVLLTWDLPMTPPGTEEVFDLAAFKAVQPALAKQFTTTRKKTQSRTMSFK